MAILVKSGAHSAETHPQLRSPRELGDAQRRCIESLPIAFPAAERIMDLLAQDFLNPGELGGRRPMLRVKKPLPSKILNEADDARRRLKLGVGSERKARRNWQAMRRLGELGLRRDEPAYRLDCQSRPVLWHGTARRKPLRGEARVPGRQAATDISLGPSPLNAVRILREWSALTTNRTWPHYQA